MHIAFLDSWLQTVAEGSGTAGSIGGLERGLLARGVKVTRLAPLKSWPTTLVLRRMLFNLQLPALLRSLKYDLIVGFDWDGCVWAAAPGDTPYLVCIKGVVAEELLHERGRTRTLFRVFAALEGYNVRRAAAVLTDSNYAAEAISRHYGVACSKVHLVPAGIDLARWQRIASEEPRSTGNATILCVGRHYPRKHVADLLHALPLVRRHVPDARAVIIGDGPETANLHRLADALNLRDAVQFLGRVANDDAVARHYFHADVFCLPSVQEGFGIVFLEAMAAGLPIVAAQAAAIPEVVPHGKAGLLVAPGSPHALADALVMLLQNPEQRRAFGAYGQQHVQQYDWGRIASLFLRTVQPFVWNADAGVFAEA